VDAERARTATWHLEHAACDIELAIVAAPLLIEGGLLEHTIGIEVDVDEDASKPKLLAPTDHKVVLPPVRRMLALGLRIDH
jgi:hypothetical protein